MTNFMNTSLTMLVICYMKLCYLKYDEHYEYILDYVSYMLYELCYLKYDELYEYILDYVSYMLYEIVLFKI